MQNLCINETCQFHKLILDVLDDKSNLISCSIKDSIDIYRTAEKGLKRVTYEARFDQGPIVSFNLEYFKDSNHFLRYEELVNDIIGFFLRESENYRLDFKKQRIVKIIE